MSQLSLPALAGARPVLGAFSGLWCGFQPASFVHTTSRPCFLQRPTIGKLDAFPQKCRAWHGTRQLYAPSGLLHDHQARLMRLAWVSFVSARLGIGVVILLTVTSGGRGAELLTVRST
jgi:hypothetical protein